MQRLQCFRYNWEIVIFFFFFLVFAMSHREQQFAEIQTKLKICAIIAAGVNA